MTSPTPRLSVVSPTFNEVENVDSLYRLVIAELEKITDDYEFIVIDNSSTDGTEDKLRELASKNPKFKVILNESNYGHIRSPYHALLQARGDAVIFMASDLQDPPSLIPKYFDAWLRGSKVVLGVKVSSVENKAMRLLRSMFYKLLRQVSQGSSIDHATGTGIFDQSVISQLRSLVEPIPYFRGLLVELGYKIEIINYRQDKRRAGKSKNSFLDLLDMSILGLINQSKTTMRIFSIAGLLLALTSAGVAIIYLILKMLFWDSFAFGFAPLLFGVFFFGAVQIFLLGLIGEYLVLIQTRLKNQPHVIERERLNFESSEGGQ
jgi:glycosyltransferase involved in cell wall biosynthesis